MKHNNVRMSVFTALLFCLAAMLVFAAPDRFTLKSPNGIAFSEFRGYERPSPRARPMTVSTLFWQIPS